MQISNANTQSNTSKSGVGSSNISTILGLVIGSMVVVLLLFVLWIGRKYWRKPRRLKPINLESSRSQVMWITI